LCHVFTMPSVVAHVKSSLRWKSGRTADSLDYREVSRILA